MKAVFTILFSLLLFAGQVVFPAAAAGNGIAAKANCACSACAKSCCVKKEAPAAPVQPAAPAQSFSQESWQLIITQALSFFELPSAKPARIAITYSISSSATAVPLYDRNCSYLI